MTTAQDIITGAYRELNLTAIGATPTTPQLAEGLLRLNAFLRILFGSKMGELLRDWQVPFSQRTAPVAANYPQGPYPANQDVMFLGLPLATGVGAPDISPYPPKNSRIIFGGTAATTVYFPEQPDDASRMAVIQGAGAGTGVALTLDGNGRTINGATTQVLTTPLTGARWIYRADLGDWRPIATLALTDLMPFSEDVDEYLVLGTAIRLAPPNDKTVSPESAKAYKDAEIIFEARYKQEGTTTFGAGNVPLGYESFRSGAWW